MTSKVTPIFSWKFVTTKFFTENLHHHSYAIHLIHHNTKSKTEFFHLTFSLSLSLLFLFLHLPNFFFLRFLTSFYSSILHLTNIYIYFSPLISYLSFLHLWIPPWPLVIATTSCCCRCDLLSLHSYLLSFSLAFSIYLHLFLSSFQLSFTFLISLILFSLILP